MNDKDNQMHQENQKEKILQKKIIILGLVGIIFGGLLIRLYNIQYDIPFDLDATSYFLYAYKLSETLQFPYWSHFPNNGWSTFLSIFFIFTNSNNFMDYVLIQRIVGVILSLSTSIVIYFLCGRFFNKFVSLVGAAIFCFEPRIITNSILGISEPLFIFLISISILFLIKNNSKYVYFSFLIAGLATLVRYEGLIIIIPLTIVYFIQNRKKKRIILKYFILIGIFFLIILPMMIIRIETIGQDGIFSHLIAGSSYISIHIIEGIPDVDDTYDGVSGKNNLEYFLSLAITNFIKFLGLTMIPIFILFIPFTLFLLFKNKSWKNIDSKTWFVILSLVVLSLPALYSYGRGIPETRYLYVLFPLFCIISTYSINDIFLKKIKKNNFLFFIIIGLVFTISLIFIEIQKDDHQHVKETFEISKIIVDKTSVINANPIEGNFLTVSGLMKMWPQTPDINESGGIITTITKKPINNYETINEFVETNNFTHIVIDENNSKEFLNDIFHNEEKYVFLEKIFDSKQNGYIYHVKIFQIDYEKYYDNTKVRNFLEE